MVAFAQRRGSRQEPSFVSVGELLRRNIPAADADNDDVTTDPAAVPEPREPEYVSVGSLLRREGRAPHSFDRP
ncbi:hypothetical protein ACFQV8_07460 [Pseudonocardia benzenivorans]